MHCSSNSSMHRVFSFLGIVGRPHFFSVFHLFIWFYFGFFILFASFDGCVWVFLLNFFSALDSIERTKWHMPSLHREDGTKTFISPADTSQLLLQIGRTRYIVMEFVITTTTGALPLALRRHWLISPGMLCVVHNFIYPLYIIIYTSPAFAIRTIQTGAYRTLFFFFCSNLTCVKLI